MRSPYLRWDSERMGVILFLRLWPFFEKWWDKFPFRLVPAFVLFIKNIKIGFLLVKKWYFNGRIEKRSSIVKHIVKTSMCLHSLFNVKTVDILLSYMLQLTLRALLNASVVVAFGIAGPQLYIHFRYGKSPTNFNKCNITDKCLFPVSYCLTLVLLNQDRHCLWKQCRSRSDGFWRSHLIRIYTVFHRVCEFIWTNNIVIWLVDNQKWVWQT